MKMKIQSFAGASEAILLESIIRISKNLWKQKKNKQRIKNIEHVDKFNHKIRQTLPHCIL